MRPPLSHHRFGLFRCPVCRGGLGLVERRLACANGHSFDLAKSGYVNLATARSRAPAVSGDTRAQLEYRARFLAHGHLDAIADVVADYAFGADAILEAGCGTGHHLAQLVRRCVPCVAAGLDLSKEAAALCARRHPNLGFAVADIWRPWPVRDRCVDVVLSAFAPKNDAEMARVLRPGGWLALAFPGAEHLQELRPLGLLGFAAGKAEHYHARLMRDFETPAQQRFLQRILLEQNAAMDALLMGPSARHLARLERDRVPDQVTVTIDVIVLVARRR